MDLTFAQTNRKHKPRVALATLQTNTITHFSQYRPADYFNLKEQLGVTRLRLLFPVLDLLLKILHPSKKKQFENEIASNNLSPENFKVLKLFIVRVTAALFNPDVPFPNFDILELKYKNEMARLRHYASTNGIEQPAYVGELEVFINFFRQKEM